VILTVILMWIAGILGFIGIPGSLVFVPIGIYFLVKASNEQDLAMRKSKNKKGIIFIVLPLAMIAVSLLILIIIHSVMAPGPSQNNFF
jgi:hypothetical protein